MNKTMNELRELTIQHLKPSIKALAAEDLVTVCVVKNNDTNDRTVGLCATGGLTDADVMQILEDVLLAYHRNASKQEPQEPPS